MNAFGGFESFLKKWLAVIHDLTARGQATPRLGRLFELLRELQLEQDFRRRAALKNASDEDLNNLIDSRMADWIDNDPELMLSAASQSGWTLIPPRDPAAPADEGLRSSSTVNLPNPILIAAGTEI